MIGTIFGQGWVLCVVVTWYVFETPGVQRLATRVAMGKLVEHRYDEFTPIPDRFSLPDKVGFYTSCGGKKVHPDWLSRVF